MEQINTEQIENNAPNISDQLSNESIDKIVWYVQSGTIKGTSEQEESVSGLVAGFLELLQKQPWAAIGEYVYGSKKGFESDNPYLIPMILISAALRQSQQSQQSVQSSIPQVVGGIN
jgi:hypothetical protein